MAPQEDGREAIQEGCGIEELKDWLYNEVADDNDCVVDYLQRDFGEMYDKEEEMLGVVQGTEEWKENVAAAAKLMQTSRNVDVLDSMVAGDEWLFDGF